jgi:phosphoserine phosphatase
MFHRRIHVVRHGVTAWNKERRFQGHIDVPLSDEGRKQAHLTAARLASLPITSCFSSDLTRAYDTAKPIAQRIGIEIEPVFDLREANKGSLEGKYLNPETGLIGDEALFHDENDVDARPPGGESLTDLGRRSERFLRDLSERDSKLPTGDLLLVSHGGTMRALLATMLGLDISAARSFHFENCSLTTIQFRGDLPPLLLWHNDVQHLRTR